ADRRSAQLEAFLELRRAPISFTVSGEVDRLAAPMMPQAATTERVAVQGDFVSITYPVDASLGFRA
ncbi:MAG: hypothetical protein K8H88_05940, partial [Sandaracinaceae bacterium]|nr:hypothetical protein [Sandaracinaceae bacterium]